MRPHLAFIAALALSIVSGRANVLTNPGFEGNAGSSIQNWTSYSSASGNVSSVAIPGVAHGGVNVLKVYQSFNGAVNYNGAFQDYISGPGAVYAADGWAYTSSSDAIAGQNIAWLEITFRDASENILALYRSALITTNSFPKSQWIDLAATNQYNLNTFVITNSTQTMTAPAGTSFVRYQVVFQGDAHNSGGSVYFDDLTLTQTAGSPYGSWNITWSEEFNGASINPQTWTYDIGNNNGWGNNELEYYTSTANNSYVSNGLLHIVVRNQSYSGYNYTSARMKTEGLFSAKYGRFEFRAKLPNGAGYWPALWMMPEDSVYGGWAASGEIDVVETVGANSTNVLGTIHFGGPYPKEAQSSGPSYNFPRGGSSTNFNTYVLEWSTNAINWYINGQLYENQTNWWSASNPNNTSILNPYPAPFNEPFYLILNVAVGGNLGGTPNNALFPGEMQVDYIRLYNMTDPLQLSAAINSSEASLAWPTNILCHLQSSANFPATNWTNITGATSPYVISPGSPSAFYRLVSP